MSKYIICLMILAMFTVSANAEYDVCLRHSGRRDRK